MTSGRKRVEIRAQLRCNGPMRDSGIRLVGHRLLLREFVDTDENAVHAFASHPAATQFMTWGPNSINDTRTFLREAVAQAGTPSRTSFGLAWWTSNCGADQQRSPSYHQH
jgi:RimJ/RimL family protein N-acetyltransferase